jgi:hypothetical protein
MTAAADVQKLQRESPADLRAAGLTVAVHNDYRLNGRAMTFWLMTWTNPAGETLAFKGEGETDGDALDQVRVAFASARNKVTGRLSSGS